jgi:hypothetical protein
LTLIWPKTVIGAKFVPAFILDFILYSIKSEDDIAIVG